VSAHAVFDQTRSSKLPKLSLKMGNIIHTDLAPAAIGPYSQATLAGQLLFISGQIPLDPSTCELVDDNIESQTHRVMLNIKAILNSAGGTFENVARMTVYLTDLEDFIEMNKVYESYVSSPEPARSTVQVAGLPKGSRVEIDAIAVMS
jgi:2-iminobutanoate/2-iminopropanoate deaminase